MIVWGKAIMINEIGIFKGKQSKYNKLALQTLYDKGPLTAWKITKELCNPTSKDDKLKTKYSLHATLNKRLRDLKDKGYLQKSGKQWILDFKGFIANLVLQDKPKVWNEKWNKVLRDSASLKKLQTKKANSMLRNYYGINLLNKKNSLTEAVDDMQDFHQFIHLSKTAKNLLKNGVINLDIIKNRTLANFLIQEQINVKDVLLDS